MRRFGAEVIRVDGDYDYSVEVCKKAAAAHGWFVVSDTSWPGYTAPPRVRPCLHHGFCDGAQLTLTGYTAPPRLSPPLYSMGVHGNNAVRGVWLGMGWRAKQPMNSTHEFCQQP
jgi:hypothetical protein